MGEQLSLKAAMPLAEILATCRKNVSNTGPRPANGKEIYEQISVGFAITNDCCFCLVANREWIIKKILVGSFLQVLSDEEQYTYQHMFVNMILNTIDVATSGMMI